MYQVKIAAMTVNGTGPFTEWTTIETYESDLTETHVPGKPTITNSKSQNINWDFVNFPKVNINNKHVLMLQHEQQALAYRFHGVRPSNKTSKYEIIY